MSTRPSQPGEEASEFSAAAVKDQLADIRDQVEKQKIPLSKEVEAYTREILRKVAEKLWAGEPVYPSDMEFIGQVKLWMGMPAEWREKYQNIKNAIKEAEKRSIDLRQWFALLDMASIKYTKGKEKEWIDDKFEFPGDRNIKCNGSVDFTSKDELIELPENLYIDGYLGLKDCSSLVELPENLHVDRYLQLSGCTKLKTLPESLFVGVMLELWDCTGLISIPNLSNVKGVVDLKGCTGLKALPENLTANESLGIVGCTGLKSLPKNMTVEGSLFLSENANEQVKHDAVRLHLRGKIKGGIVYR